MTNPFSYVMGLLSGLYDYKDLTLLGYTQEELAWLPLRDSFFLEILDSFKEKPIKVFQVGAIESLENNFRCGSGWSELFWGKYIKKYGGELWVVDINPNHIAHSHFLSRHNDYFANYYMGDAMDVIDKQICNIYYLDGADESKTPDAHDQTLNQFKKIEDTHSLVIVDDVPTKAQKLIQYLNEKKIEYKHHPYYGSGMLTIDMRVDMGFR